MRDTPRFLRRADAASAAAFVDADALTRRRARYSMPPIRHFIISSALIDAAFLRCSA
jgi:hypothetical protein